MARVLLLCLLLKPTAACGLETASPLNPGLVWGLRAAWEVVHIVKWSFCHVDIIHWCCSEALPRSWSR